MSEEKWRLQQLEGELRSTRVIAWVAVLLHVPWMAAGLTMLALKSGVLVIGAPAKKEAVVQGPTTAEALTQRPPDPIDEPEAEPEAKEPEVEPTVADEPGPPQGRRPTGRAPKATTTALVEEGWGFVEQGLNDAAENTFRRAVDAEPTNAEAHLGYAYALLRNSRSETAKVHLCEARRFSGEDIELFREAEGLLRKHEMSCR